MAAPSFPSFTMADPAYPELLRHLPQPPQLLYYRGEPAALSGPCLSVVGSREMSPYGRRVLEALLPPLVRSGLVIVSGLAYGVDGYSHQLALQYGGRCVAVLGSGLDRVYPPIHAPLLEQLLAGGGCAISEYPAGTAPERFHFPQRNRLVAGLSPVLLVVEAGERSGTLITAGCALDAGREVCVVPGDIGREQSRGVHGLLKKGARPVTTADDLLELYGLPPECRVPERLRPALTGSLATLYDLISQGHETVEQLVRTSGLGVVELQNILSVLELDGYVRCNLNRWQRISS